VKNYIKSLNRRRILVQLPLLVGLLVGLHPRYSELGNTAFKTFAKSDTDRAVRRADGPRVTLSRVYWSVSLVARGDASAVQQRSRISRYCS
jgi:hypothetical protein